MIAFILKLLEIRILRNVERKTYIILDNLEQYEAIDLLRNVGYFPGLGAE